jgi:hypothetical protein
MVDTPGHADFGGEVHKQKKDFQLLNIFCAIASQQSIYNFLFRLSGWWEWLKVLYWWWMLVKAPWHKLNLCFQRHLDLAYAQFCS